MSAELVGHMIAGDRHGAVSGQVGEPAPFGPRERRAVNQLGLTHLSFRVRDVAGTAARMVELGGAIVETSRTSIDFGGTALEFVYCTDPDGVRVELMDLGG